MRGEIDEKILSNGLWEGIHQKINLSDQTMRGGGERESDEADGSSRQIHR